MIKISADLFDPWHEVVAYQDSAKHWTGKFGATNVFVGTMRDFNDGDAVTGMVLEHYPGMTEKQLEDIVKQATRDWHLLDALVVHRVGEIKPNEPIVLVAVWASHRGDAFDAGRQIMEALKNKAPFWKKERLPNGDERWVEHNTDGYLRSPKNDMSTILG
ncbi:molybdenum cofactor biosynthesis protein MoaE [Methylotuvimicrobium buryatense]|uniref:Molybdopterin synthase catalytic subunit n=1 Tax=Methylotuvimicrobium buryatense TaxID=95641 RepID=A0A4P9UPN3_METBY|nr:molybdenum cofactor biosynthesis protein MoaE [Methylotuvimicrobium buryatense]QCW81516.1 molybdenum cofactor biosynthesis protein MoaE [Methylotuvimicrobium buryatense]